MKSVILPAIATMVLAGPAWAQDRTAAPLKTVRSATRNATVEPAANGFVSGAQVYPFSDGTIYQVYTAPGLVTDIALQPGETLVAVASGDTARWVIGDTTSGSGDDKQTHVLVKPVSAGLLTNLVITTDRRAYHLRLASTTATALSSLRWTYPQDELLAVRRKAEAAQAAAPVATGLAIEQLHFNYAISGDRPPWRPLRVFDDGTRTYVEFPASLANGDAPPLFVVGPNGKVELVNYRLRDRFYVVDRIFDAAELRLGLKKQQVVRIDRIGPSAQRRGA
ncbi:P-type conjugative transfer protein TrbG [Sphingomonas sanguinis]|jgi:P-type conjugative transfer protein TrbG|uniref:Conjugal transfer protein TrbG n=1 Tax=Sphingomonas sanguinis TaxID=33051 RepID=A0A147I194_9SPHN|nr:P-type conjugative transfer protein TrbG [Sphingomonas sanguinis]KTT71208.1 conjugal transfer protein TrbG [Sphingomonas sanguinis]MBZ6382699.1 P-type conjugative transfer protein TrbG [Sphingomonas sanguinis]NNG49774.1 P-type conjugative transfer protein TrbG [Sphingomonas sanguinis]NNG54583.1 P-type conjugative transfer protein TrbG [Sphingomonas sanguinis]NVP31997.1 P-type conjugative transfer protein TrbG [Sphingomonas sanguinis]